MADREIASHSTHETPPAIGDWADGDRHASDLNDAVLLELQGVFYEPVDPGAQDDLSITARSEAIAVTPTHILGRYIKDKTKSLSAEADRASQSSPTILSSSKDRIEYANDMALLAGQKLILRELLELLVEASGSGRSVLGNSIDLSAK